MGQIKFELISTSDNKNQMLTMPDDQKIKFIISKLIKDWSLDKYDEKGKSISWELYYPSACQILSENDTLKDAGVSENDTIFLQQKNQKTVNSDLDTPLKPNEAVLDWQEDSTGSPHSFHIKDGRAIIGRFDSDTGPVDIDLTCLPEEKSEHISRHHAEIWCDEKNQWFIKDLGSVNGTFYRIKSNKEGAHKQWIRVSEKQLLHDGYSIALGNVPFEFHVK